jgi:2-polyprenyl-6-methoxyphenol hydroxylase-like FAD-dependent oxidoreductase
VFREEPRLQLTGADHLGDSQVVGAIVTPFGNPRRRVVRVRQNDFVGLQEARQHRRHLLATVRGPRYPCDLRDVPRIAHGDATEGLYPHERPDGSEEICEAAYLAGCDGARSTVSEALAIGFPGGTYSQLFYVAAVEALGVATDDEVHLDLDVADLVAVFAMKGKGHTRLVGTVCEEPADGRGELTFADL